MAGSKTVHRMLAITGAKAVLLMAGYWNLDWVSNWPGSAGSSLPPALYPAAASYYLALPWISLALSRSLGFARFMSFVSLFLTVLLVMPILLPRLYGLAVGRPPQGSMTLEMMLGLLLLLSLASIPAAAFVRFVGILSEMASEVSNRTNATLILRLLREKGYDYSLGEATALCRRIGRRRIERLPHRDELAVLPDFGEGTPRDVAYLIKKIEYRQR